MSMPDGSTTLIIPAILPTGTLHLIELPDNCRTQDVIRNLVSIDGVKEEILGTLEDHGWALQRIRREKNGRVWEEDELNALGDGESLYQLE